MPVQFQCSVADVKQLCFSACAPRTWLEWFNQRNPASPSIFSLPLGTAFSFFCSIVPLIHEAVQWRRLFHVDFIHVGNALDLFYSLPEAHHSCGFCSLTVDLLCGTGCWEVFCGPWCGTNRRGSLRTLPDCLGLQRTERDVTRPMLFCSDSCVKICLGEFTEQVQKLLKVL